MNQHDALQIAQKLLSGLPGYYKAGVEVATLILLLRFHFPVVAQRRYAELFAQLEAQTGWYVRLHPTAHQEALVEMARRVLPQGLTCKGTPSLYLDLHVVAVQCQGDASPEALQEAQRRFAEETGWQLELVMSGQKTDISRRMPQGEAIALASEMFSTVPGFYRVGADATKGNLWVHFHFPDVVKQRYTEQLAALAAQTGWRVYVYPNVHQKALIEATTRLLPESVSVIGKSSLQENRRMLSLTCTGEVSVEDQEDMQRRFAEETGWQLELQFSGY